MTPAITDARRHNISHRIHEYPHDSSSESYGHEAAEKLGISADRVFKTLVVHLDNNDLAVAVVPVSTSLSMKLMAKAAGAKKAAMADRAEVERSTGYVLGGVSPLGQKKRLQTIIDLTATDFDSIFVSAGRRGLEIELSPHDLKTLTGGTYADIRQ